MTLIGISSYFYLLQFLIIFIKISVLVSAKMDDFLKKLVVSECTKKLMEILRMDNEFTMKLIAAKDEEYLTLLGATFLEDLHKIEEFHAQLGVDDLEQFKIRMDGRLINEILKPIEWHSLFAIANKWVKQQNQAQAIEEQRNSNIPKDVGGR